MDKFMTTGPPQLSSHHSLLSSFSLLHNNSFKSSPLSSNSITSFLPFHSQPADKNSFISNLLSYSWACKQGRVLLLSLYRINRSRHNTILFCDSHLRRQVSHDRRRNSVYKWPIKSFRLKTNVSTVKKYNLLTLLQISLKNIQFRLLSFKGH